jgi:hypothetical protein
MSNQFGVKLPFSATIDELLRVVSKNRPKIERTVSPYSVRNFLYENLEVYVSNVMTFWSNALV